MKPVEALVRCMIRRRGVVIAVYVLLAPLALYLASSVLGQLKFGGYEDPDRESWQVSGLLQEEFGLGTGDILAVYRADGRSVYDVAVAAEILEIIARLENEPDVASVRSAYTTGASYFVSEDEQTTFLAVDLHGDEQAKMESFGQLQPVFAANTLVVQFAGLIPANLSVFETIRRDLARAELLALPLTALVVYFVFGSLVAVSVLLAAGVGGILLSFAALRIVASFADVSIFAVNTIMLLGLGLAVDYSLFLVNRYREELRRHSVDDAIRRTLETTGRAIAFSGITVAASLCGLLVFEQMVLRSLALGGIVVSLGSVLLALTLVPSLLAIVGRRIDVMRNPFLKPVGEGARLADNFWYQTALAVMRRPVATSVLVAALLVALALPFARFSGSVIDWRALPADNPVHSANEILDAEFAPNQGTPHLVLATLPDDVLAPANLERLAQLAQQLADLSDVGRVDSVFTFIPGASITETATLLLERGPDNPQIDALLANFTSGSRMFFSVVSTVPFDDQYSLEQVRAIRAMSTDDMQVQVAGYSAALIDLEAAIRDRAPWMVSAVLGAMFVILFIAFGSVTLPFKAMLMNVLSLTASFGAIVWIFQDGRLEGLLNYTSLGFSDITLPLVMFAIVFGLSMDYEVFLLSRVREEYVRCRDNSKAVAVGLARTGRLITSAGALLLVVVAAFATSDIVFMKALGVGMALAILLDITIVRALLVPATMHLMGRWNWYAPRLLKRLWAHTGFSD